MNAEEVRGYALGTLEEWFDGYFSENPQYRAKLADYTDDWAEFEITAMGPYGPEASSQRFRIQIHVKEMQAR